MWAIFVMCLTLKGAIRTYVDNMVDIIDIIVDMIVLSINQSEGICIKSHEWVTPGDIRYILRFGLLSEILNYKEVSVTE